MVVSLWTSRDEALKALDNELQKDKAVVESTFAYLDALISAFKDDTAFLRVTGLITIKARTLCHSMYSLALDGHAQESGALLRPAIEAYELLTYLRQDPQRVNQVLDGKLPKAGKIAQIIDGEFHGLRDHLNDHASHFGFTVTSLRHLLTFKDGFLYVHPDKFHPTVLRTNMATLTGFMGRVILEAMQCLKVEGLLTDDLIIQGHSVFTSFKETFADLGASS